MWSPSANQAALKLSIGLSALMISSTVIAQAQAVTTDAGQESGAEAPKDESAAAAPRNRFIEEIVVTAQKREENLQDVPISIQAFSADALSARGIEDPKALQLATPGLQYNVVAGYSVIYIRGVGTDAFVASADPSVATYIDGVYYAFAHGLAQALGSVERVEILKGPQGTLFGRNATGGAINIITKQPDQTPRTEIEASMAEFDKRNIRAFTNIPVTESFAVSVSGLKYSEDNYYKLAASSPRKEFPKELSQGYSLGTHWSPIDDLQAIVGYKYIRTSGATAMMLPTSYVKPLGQVLGVRQQPDYITSESAPTYINTLSKVLSTDIKYQMNFADARFIGSNQRTTSPGMADIDGSDRPLVNFEARGQFANVNTAELQMLSNSSSWGSDWLKWIGGVYYLESRIGYRPLYVTVAPDVFNYLANPQNPLLGGLLQASAPLFSAINELVPADGTPLDLNNGLGLSLVGILGTQTVAGFFQTTANFGDAWALTLGGRYQYEQRKLEQSDVGVIVDQSSTKPGAPLISFSPRSEKFTNFSPKVVLDYRPFGDDLLYVSYSKGFKSGTYNIINIYTQPQFIKPEDTTAYELGYKGTLLSGALRYSAAVFQNNIKNVQVQTVSLLSGGVVRLETAGKGRIRGAEFDLTWQVAPDVLPGLVLTAGGAGLDGKYLKYDAGSGYDEITGIYFDGTIPIFPARDFAGHDIVRTPHFTGTVGPSYTFDFSDSSIEVAGDAYYNSGFYYTAQNRDSSHQEAFTVVNARISYFYEPWRLRLTAFGKNITDERYTYTKLEFDFGTASTLAPPATYGLRVNWDF